MRTLLAPVARLILKLMGWQLVGEPPRGEKKLVIVAAFHTTNWDGLLMVLAMLAMNVRIVWVIKQQLMWFPLGPILRWLGALPLDREHSQGVTEQIVDQFNRRDSMVLILSPEGTRRKVTRWKKGFYVIAERAHVPILLTGIDYPRKQMVIGPIFRPSGNIDADLDRIRAFYKDFTPKYPERAGDIAFSRTHDAME